MGKKEWFVVGLLILLSNSVSLFVVKKYLIKEPKIVDIVKLLEEDKQADIRNVLAGKMTQEEFIAKQTALMKKIEDVVNAENEVIFVRQCILGTKYEDITERIKNNLNQ